jgi:hypothetical protein
VLQFPLVEEDSAAVTALLNVDTIALIGAHGSLTLGADHFSHISMVDHPRLLRNLEVTSPST